jgi:hypothetical protein
VIVSLRRKSAADDADFITHFAARDWAEDKSAEANGLKSPITIDQTKIDPESFCNISHKDKK